MDFLELLKIKNMLAHMGHGSKPIVSYSERFKNGTYETKAFISNT